MTSFFRKIAVEAETKTKWRGFTQRTLIGLSGSGAWANHVRKGTSDVGAVFDAESWFH